MFGASNFNLLTTQFTIIWHENIRPLNQKFQEQTSIDLRFPFT